MTRLPVAGFLCYDLSPASRGVLSTIARAASGFTVKAFPLLGPPPDDPLPFAFRPSHTPGRYISFGSAPGKAPESQVMVLGLPVVRALTRESDVVCLLGIQAMPAFLSAAVARLTRKPIVTVTQMMGPEAERRRAASIRALKRRVLRWASMHVVQTPATAATLTEVYGIPEERIVPALWDGAAGEFTPVLDKHRATPRAALRESLGLPASAYVVLFCGTLIYLKGVDVLLDAFAALGPADPEAVLAIVGDDGKTDGKRAALREQVERLGLAPRVRFLGGLPWDRLAQWYLASDVLALPTRKDMWPKVLVEGALAGLPLVTTETCGASGYLVRDGVNGLVVPVDDSGALAHALLALRDPEMRSRMGQASTGIVRDYMDPGAEASGYVRAIRQALSMET